MHFWDSNVWSWILLFGVLFGSLLIGKLLKKIPFLQKSLIPTSVLGGAIILLVTGIYKFITKNSFFDAGVFRFLKKKHRKRCIACGVLVDSKGIEPSTLRMRTVRSPS